MADIHIDDFYKDAGLIFLRLYSQFPRKTILYVDDIVGPDQPDEFGLHSTRFLAGFSTMLWLAEQGYIQYEQSIRQEALDQAVLSQRGFMMLSSITQPPSDAGDDRLRDTLPPSVQQYKCSNISQLREAIKDGSSIAISRIMHRLLAL